MPFPSQNLPISSHHSWCRIHTPSLSSCGQDLALSNLLSLLHPPAHPLPRLTDPVSFYQHNLLPSFEHLHMPFPLPGRARSSKGLDPASCRTWLKNKLLKNHLVQESVRKGSPHHLIHSPYWLPISAPSISAPRKTGVCLICLYIPSS